MEKPELTKEESECYMKIVQHGNMDDMFDLGYAIGRVRASEEALKSFSTKLN